MCGSLASRDARRRGESSQAVTMDDRIGVIAGAGRFPLHVAERARRRGLAVFAVGLRGWVDPALATHVEGFAELSVGQLGELIRWFASRGVRQAIMAGKVAKAALLEPPEAFDAVARRVLAQARERSAPAILGAVGECLAEAGIRLLDSSTFLADELCPAGVVSARGPTASELEDVRIGWAAARAIAGLDIGQTVVVKARLIVAVEAMEGTDAAIRRAHALAGEGLVVVKAASPRQDRRFDLPVVGLETIATLADVKASCLGVEAGSCLLLDRDALVAAADARGLCLIGVEPDAEVARVREPHAR
jgi:DUF1009 family protein